MAEKVMVFYAKVVTFDDGSRLISEDRETIRYEEQGRATLVWIDYEDGFFSRGRIIKEISLEYWHTSPSKTDDPISVEKKAEIIGKIRQYFGNRPVRVEPK